MKVVSLPGSFSKRLLDTLFGVMCVDSYIMRGSEAVTWGSSKHSYCVSTVAHW